MAEHLHTRGRIAVEQFHLRKIAFQMSNGSRTLHCESMMTLEDF